MKNIFKYLIPYTCISVTIVLIVTSIFNLLAGDDIWYYAEWLLMIGTMFVLYAIQFGTIERFEFKTAIGYYAAGFFVWYAGLGVYLFGTGWMGFYLKNVIVYTVIMIVVFILLRKYNQIYIRFQSDEINQRLKAQK